MSRPSSPDSLFDEPSEAGDIPATPDTEDEYDRAPVEDTPIVPASRAPPPIPGLYVFPGLLPPDVATPSPLTPATALRALSDADHFVGGARDQVMLFSAPPPAPCALPAHIRELDQQLSSLLAPHLPPSVHTTAFSQPLARQAILNLYPPGTGITPHIDLAGRYADGIVGASLAGGCVMTLSRGEERFDLYLPPRSVYVLSGEARWEWTHGIPARAADVVEGTTMPRDLRVSVTLRWMQDGAGTVG